MTSSNSDLTGRPRPWTRRERQRAEIAVVSRGFTDIRAIAHEPERAGNPVAALGRIRMIADACHNLPGAARPGRRGSGPEPFAWAWQTASPDQREWLTEILQSLGLDTAWLDTVPARRSPDHPRRTLGVIRIWSRKRGPSQIQRHSSLGRSTSQEKDRPMRNPGGQLAEKPGRGPTSSRRPRTTVRRTYSVVCRFSS